MTQLLTSPRTKRAANVLGIVLLIALVAPFAAYAAPEVVGADESFVVLTASMTPAIAPGDVVIVAERDPAAIAEGDVITFVRGTSNVPVTHRVIGVTGEGATLAFETMGDANEGPDPGLVPAGNLVGTVTLTIPWIGYVIQFAGTQVGFVALVLLPFGLLAVTEIWSIVRDREGPGSGPSLASPIVSKARAPPSSTTSITRCVTGTSLVPRTNVITSPSATVVGSRSATITTSPGAIDGVMLAVSTTKLSSAPTTSGAANTANGATRAISTTIPSTFAARFAPGDVSSCVISSPPSRTAARRPLSFRP